MVSHFNEDASADSFDYEFEKSITENTVKNIDQTIVEKIFEAI